MSQNVVSSQLYNSAVNRHPTETIHHQASKCTCPRHKSNLGNSSQQDQSRRPNRKSRSPVSRILEESAVIPRLVKAAYSTNIPSKPQVDFEQTQTHHITSQNEDPIIRGEVQRQRKMQQEDPNVCPPEQCQKMACPVAASQTQASQDPRMTSPSLKVRRNPCNICPPSIHCTKSELQKKTEKDIERRLRSIFKKEHVHPPPRKTQEGRIYGEMSGPAQESPCRICPQTITCPKSEKQKLVEKIDKKEFLKLLKPPKFERSINESELLDAVLEGGSFIRKGRETLEDIPAEIEDENERRYYREIEKMVRDEVEEVDIALTLQNMFLRSGIGIDTTTRKESQRQKLQTMHRQLREMRKKSQPFTVFEGEEPDDILPEVAAAMMYTEEQGLYLADSPEDLFDYLFKDNSNGRSSVDIMPAESGASQVVPVRLEAQADPGINVAEVNSQVEEQPASNLYSETVGDERRSQDKQQKQDDDVDSCIEYILKPRQPSHSTYVQMRGSQLPSWFPGYFEAQPHLVEGLRLTHSPSRVLQTAWGNTHPYGYDQSNVIFVREAGVEEEVF